MPFVPIPVQAMGRKPPSAQVCAILLVECNLVNLDIADSLKSLTLERSIFNWILRVETQQILVSVALLK